MLDLDGKIVWPGKLEIHTTTKVLGSRQMREAVAYIKSAKHPIVIMQLNSDDSVRQYYYNGAWVQPKTRLCYFDAVNAIIRHKNLSLVIPEFFTFIVKQ